MRKCSPQGSGQNGRWTSEPSVGVFRYMTHTSKDFVTIIMSWEADKNKTSLKAVDASTQISGNTTTACLGLGRYFNPNTKRLHMLFLFFDLKGLTSSTKITKITGEETHGRVQGKSKANENNKENSFSHKRITNRNVEQTNFLLQEKLKSDQLIGHCSVELTSVAISSLLSNLFY